MVAFISTFCFSHKALVMFLAAYLGFCRRVSGVNSQQCTIKSKHMGYILNSFLNASSALEIQRQKVYMKDSLASFSLGNVSCLDMPYVIFLYLGMCVSLAGVEVMY